MHVSVSIIKFVINSNLLRVYYGTKNISSHFTVEFVLASYDFILALYISLLHFIYHQTFASLLARLLSDNCHIFVFISSFFSKEQPTNTILISSSYHLHFIISLDYNFFLSLDSQVLNLCFSFVILSSRNNCTTVQMLVIVLWIHSLATTSTEPLVAHSGVITCSLPLQGPQASTSSSSAGNTAIETSATSTSANNIGNTELKTGVLGAEVAPQQAGKSKRRKRNKKSKNMSSTCNSRSQQNGQEAPRVAMPTALKCGLYVCLQYSLLLKVLIHRNMTVRFDGICSVVTGHTY